jgi:purine-nucleoside phosphorylase
MNTATWHNPEAYEEVLEESAATLRTQFGASPEVVVVAGSGLGGFAKRIRAEAQVSYEAIPHFPRSTVQGHEGVLVMGELAGRRVTVMSGRKHIYEGVDPMVTVHPLRTLLRMGTKVVILSNAAGALSRFFTPGDLMLITDHINFQFRSVLLGPNLDSIGPRFPDMSEPYDRGLQKIARDVAVEQGIVLREGVYFAVTGPSYETQAEVQMMRQMADAVGMSTAPETIAAVHAGAKVLGISAITNSLVLKTGAITTHDEVMETGRQVAATFGGLVEGIISRLPA